MTEVKITIKMTKNGNGNMLVKKFDKQGKQLGEANYPFEEYRELLWFFVTTIIELWRRGMKKRTIEERIEKVIGNNPGSIIWVDDPHIDIVKEIKSLLSDLLREVIGEIEEEWRDNVYNDETTKTFKLNVLERIRQRCKKLGIKI